MDLFYIDTSSYILAQKLFIKLIGFCYLLAFWSLFKQVLGLYGSKGIIPIQDTMRRLHHSFISKPFLKVPTFFWVDASDRTLRITAAIGIVISLFVMIGILPAISLLVIWFLYLSFVSVGMEFLSFQWDVLLLEVGFISIFFAIQSPPPFFLLLSLWFLLFRFHISSGAVKLLSGCPSWACLTALDVHYETQPIPNRMAYYIHQQPKWMSKFSTIVMFVVELAVPFLIFTTDELRLVAFFLLVGLQLTIIFTGNYAFFNILTIALCVLLLNNSSLDWLISNNSQTDEIPNMPVRIGLEAVGVVLLFLNALELTSLFIKTPIIRRILGVFSPFYIVNSYGLFAWMTVTRDEIIVEGSEDGKNWLAYEFKWKPGDLKIPPRQVAPYHPRLDWQMWFAALSNYRSNYWYIDFLIRLLEGSPDVLALLDKNPFPGKPPKYIRSLLYKYNFTDIKSKKATGQWWTRTYKGLYTPTLTLTSKNL